LERTRLDHRWSGSVCRAGVGGFVRRLPRSWLFVGGLGCLSTVLPVSSAVLPVSLAVVAALSAFWVRFAARAALGR
jgi:hypothetical protein